MKILVIGSGAREHAICYNLSKNEKVSKVYCAPGNAGTAKENKCKNVKISTIDEILNFAKKVSITSFFVGNFLSATANNSLTTNDDNTRECF